MFGINPAVADLAQPTDQLSENEPIQLLRTINTAELDLLLREHRAYASLQELIQHRFFQRRAVGPTILVADPTSGRVKNYRVVVSVPPQGEQYNVSVTPVGPPCRVAFFTNEAGVIYKGQALGCDQPKP